MSEIFNVCAAAITFLHRYFSNRGKEKIDNASLYTGSPMYYYCNQGCDCLITMLPESHTEPAPQYCQECQILADHGLLSELRQYAESLSEESWRTVQSGAQQLADPLPR